MTPGNECQSKPSDEPRADDEPQFRVVHLGTGEYTVDQIRELIAAAGYQVGW